MEDFVHDLPLAVDFQQREQVGEPVSRVSRQAIVATVGFTYDQCDLFRR